MTADREAQAYTHLAVHSAKKATMVVRAKLNKNSLRAYTTRHMIRRIRYGLPFVG